MTTSFNLISIFNSNCDFHSFLCESYLPSPSYRSNSIFFFLFVKAYNIVHSNQDYKPNNRRNNTDTRIRLEECRNQYNGEKCQCKVVRVRCKRHFITDCLIAFRAEFFAKTQLAANDHNPLTMQAKALTDVIISNTVAGRK